MKAIIIHNSLICKRNRTLLHTWDNNYSGTNCFILFLSLTHSLTLLFLSVGKCIYIDSSRITFDATINIINIITSSDIKAKETGRWFWATWSTWAFIQFIQWTREAHTHTYDVGFQEYKNENGKNEDKRYCGVIWLTVKFNISPNENELRETRSRKNGTNESKLAHIVFSKSDDDCCYCCR